MILTNKLGLPKSIEQAVRNDPYSRGDAHISVSQLIGPARKRALEIRHADELTEDVADRIWSLMGQIAHGILERADHEAWTEERLFITRHGWRISGQFDRVLLEDDGLCQDYKISSTWSVKDGVKPEWEAQANLYCLMLREHGYTVRRAQIVVVLRDWQKSKAKHDANYPQAPCVVLNVPMWSPEQGESYIVDRLTAHGNAQHKLPQCTAEERWERPAKWALRKEGNKRATSLHDTQEEAESARAAHKDAGKMAVEHRPDESLRCMDYCAAAPHCRQWEELNRITRVDFAA
jgi:hypothetical protein